MKITREDVHDMILREMQLLLSEQPEDTETDSDKEVEKSLDKPVSKGTPVGSEPKPMAQQAPKPAPKIAQTKAPAPAPVAKAQPKPVQKAKPSLEKPIAKQSVPVVPKQAPVVEPTVKEPGQAEQPGQPQPEVPAPEPRPMNKLQYQIWNTKLRMGQLDLPLLAKKFSDSLHTFDLRVTKNTKDGAKITGFLTPTKGDLEALKGALESLQVEFDKLARVAEESSTPTQGEIK